MQKDNQENGLFKPFPKWKMLVLPRAETCEGNQGDTRFSEDAIVVEREREDWVRWVPRNPNTRWSRSSVI